ncbi:uncharacterized protein LOC116255701 isoform X1 [Nymphaea colorata]|nr:uncharacterized protein LOC116255701 isoform X1 [Nymphaea colorata]
MRTPLNKSRNEKKREAKRAVKWGMDLAQFPPPQIKLILKAAALEQEVFEALMLAKEMETSEGSFRDELDKVQTTWENRRSAEVVEVETNSVAIERTDLAGTSSAGDLEKKKIELVDFSLLSHYYPMPILQGNPVFHFFPFSFSYFCFC